MRRLLRRLREPRVLVRPGALLLHACFDMWTHAPASVLHLKHVAVKVGNPLPSLNCQFEIFERISNEGFDLAPEKVRILVGDVGRRRITKARVAPDFLELVEQRIELPRIKWISEL